VQLLLSGGGKIVITTPDAETDLEKLDWDADDVRALLGCLRHNHHHKSEWCLTGNRLWLDCDAYVIRFNEYEGTEDQNFPEYFVKFGFANNSVVCAIISCHLS
jgi:hypothetical protein